ncbi:SAM-dependent methyltransferase [Rhodococcus sp. NPDC056960]|uniref:SAM-dependent methyltransferase n=1 Tax=Rhodococcus sp. NPDC056960 TaxID=3345982 RepID=UPI0036287B90
MRAEGDSWDIKTGVGSTALMVAAARGLAARRPNPIVVDQFAEVFCRAAGDEWAALFDADEEQTRDHPLRSPDFGESFQVFQAARTKYFDDYFDAAIDAGVRQVVILAAGLDSRAYRLPWRGGTVVYELDRPQVLDFKRRALADHGARPIAERREVATDLREEWPQALRESGFDPAVPSAWLAEGLLLYLPPAAQDQLFAAVDTLSAPGSFAGIEQMEMLDTDSYTAMTAPDDGDNDAGAQWAGLIYNEPRSEATHWFGEHGWSAHRTVLTDYLTVIGTDVSTEPGTVGASMLPSITLITATRPT